LTQYFVLAVVLVIFFGLWLYLWTLDAKVSRLKSELDAEREEDKSALQ
jgi:CcmD family protein